MENYKKMYRNVVYLVHRFGKPMFLNHPAKKGPVDVSENDQKEILD
jgi:hypothetical protein